MRCPEHLSVRALLYALQAQAIRNESARPEWHIYQYGAEERKSVQAIEVAFGCA